MAALPDLARSFLETSRPASLSPEQARRLSPVALAYIGDAIYELHVRLCYLFPPKRQHLYHRSVVAQVRAEAQALHLQTLQPYLTDRERNIAKQGRNAAIEPSRRMDRSTYQQASGLEALVGYLYLTDPDRLLQLFAYLSLDRPPPRV